MDCLPLLRISARLLDLHDSERALGKSPVFSQEERRGLRDGRYVDIAGMVLGVLRANAHASGNAFMGFDSLLIEVRRTYADADDDDVRYVLSVLSRPTELWTIDRSDSKAKLVSDKATELVEKTVFADDYRLSSGGRTAIGVAANIQTFAYAEGDVTKLLRAIEAGDFERVPLFCDALLDTIRYESLNLRQAIEKGFVDRESAVFKNQLPRYRGVIERSADLLSQARSKLKGLRVSDTTDLDETVDFDLYDLDQHVLRVYQALEAFNRELAELLTLAAQRRTSVVAPPDFLASALALVRNPPSLQQTAYFFRNFGPLSFDGIFPSPMDTAGKVRVQTDRLLVPEPFETEGAEPLAVDSELVFLKRYADEIRDRLSEGPIALTEAIERGWCVLEGSPVLGELLGVYLSPWALGTPESIALRVPAHVVATTHPALGELLLQDIEVSLEREKAI
jgi:hypothetical protein